ncbi:fibronectin-binding autotransporter adhesin [Mesorhizobium loti]|uniref:Fibronectin-binding autotransporter adhesin n=1 Tax=Rhizobium loti TaxID=381 RepID=A0A8E2WDC6_RHILI|nr:autotransporter outer membrane beta-barrel domain-containing protein [Mesorhizobium loti]PWJ91816.1 fibronectin-binding autotransporter adhesin [Mesorhizobium loti]
MLGAVSVAALLACGVAMPQGAYAADGGQGISTASGVKGGAGGVDGTAAEAEGTKGPAGASITGGGGGATDLTTGNGQAGGNAKLLGGVSATRPTNGGAGAIGLATVSGTVSGGNGAGNLGSGIAGGGGGVGLSTTMDLTVQAGGAVKGGAGGSAGSSSGGGGGGVGVFTSADVTIDALGTVTGGAGGLLAGQGGGGGGAAALLVTGGGTITNSGTLLGGKGGDGRAGFPTGAGGSGGEGIRLINGGTVVNNAGASITGGAAGLNGAGIGGFGVAASSGGAGIKGANVSVLNAGTISGGATTGGGRVNAITFTGGVNSLELWSTSLITGNVQAFSAADSFTLGGAGNGSFNAASIGNSAQYRGFGSFEKTGSGTWVLTGVTSALTPWTLSGGTLSIAGDGSLGDAASGLVFNGGTLQTTASFTTNRGMALNTTGKIDTAAATTLTASGILSGAGGLTKTGGGTLELTGDNSYSGETTVSAGKLALSGTGSIAASSRAVVDGTLDISGVADGASIKRLAGAGTVEFGNQTLTLTEANDTFSGDFAGNGGFVLAGGQQMLTGDSSLFAGSSRVEGGTLSVNGTLGGTMDVLGGRLQGNGTVGATTNHLGGVIAPGIDGFGTLMVDGTYTSNGGALEIETVLAGDSSQTDLLIITGNSILGTSTTQVHVFNVGGLGAQTTADGIKIVQVDGTSAADAFVLNGPAIGGAYSYKLFQNGLANTTDGDWYLRAASLAPTTPVYQNYPQVLLGMIALPTLEQRVGDRRRTVLDGGAETGQQAIWTRFEGAHGHVEANASSADASYDVDTTLVQAGIDGQLSETAAGRLVAGLTAQYSRTDADIFSSLGEGGNTTVSYGVGATLTWYGENGFYVDGQAQLATLRSDMNAAVIGKIGDGIHGNGYALSLEAGRKIGLDGAWSLTPQAQLAYASVDFDAFTDPFGANVSLRKGDSLKGRLGAALNYDVQATGSHVYGIANLTYEFLNGTSVAVSGVDLSFEPQRFGGELGLGGTYKWAGGKYTLFGEALASSSFEGSHALKGTAGIIVRF